METGFDAAAKSYDTDFTDSIIGNRQRAKVHEYLDEFLKHNFIENVLEINCGTGTDAIWLADNNAELNVFATDVSEAMIETAKSKITTPKPNLRFDVADIKNIESANHHNDYRLLFSNFGGLNCLNITELKTFLIEVEKILKPHASLILVIMPRKTFMENIYRFFKGQSKIYKQRKSDKGLEVNVNGNAIKTFYFNSKEIEKMNENFCCEIVKPIGFFPSYFEPKVKKFKSIFKIFFKMENFFLKFSSFANYADHYLIHLKLK